MAEKNPGSYDPLSTEPYIAPDPVAISEPTLPFPQAFDSNNLGAAAAQYKSTAPLAVASSFVTGLIRGRALKAANEAKKNEQLIQGAHESYNNDARAYLQLKAAGLPDNDPDVVKAKNATSVSYENYLGQLERHIAPPKGQKKGIGQRIKGALATPDLLETAPEVLNAMSKSGPPVFSKGILVAAQLAQEQREQEFQNRIFQQKISASLKPKFITKYTGEDGKVHEIWENPDGTTYEQVSSSEVVPKTANAPKVGSFNEFVTQAFGQHPTAKQELEARRLWAAATVGTTVGQHTILVPQPDGTFRAFTTETTSTKTLGGIPGERSKNPPGREVPSRTIQPGEIVGGKESPVDKATLSVLTKQYDRTSDEERKARNTLQLAQVAANDPTNSVASKQLRNTSIHSSLGRVAQAEINDFNHAGGAVMSLEGGIAQVKSGTMSTAQLSMYLRFATAQYRNAKANQEKAQKDLQSFGLHQTTGESLPEDAKKQLKPGHITEFSNGQKWTLDANGQAQQVY